MKKKDNNKNKLDTLRKIGIVPREYLAVDRAGQFWRSSHRWIPLVSLWIKFCCMVALLGALACLVIVFARPRPVLLVSYPDGLTLCSMPPLNPKTGQPIARPSREAALCNSLARRAGRATDEENLRFASEIQKEPAAVEMPPLSDAAMGIEKPAPAQPAPVPAGPIVQPSPVFPAPTQATPVSPASPTGQENL